MFLLKEINSVESNMKQTPTTENTSVVFMEIDGYFIVSDVKACANN